MTYEVQQTRWDQLIRRTSGSIGPGSRVSETLSELFPVMEVETNKGELQLLQGTRLAMSGGDLAAVAGQVQLTSLFNPVNSGTIITVTQVIVATSGASGIGWGLATTRVPGPLGTETFRDTRLSLGAVPVGQVGEVTQVAAGISQAFTVLPNNTPFQLIDENDVAVLAPGTALHVNTTTVATQLIYTYLWRERAALPSELQF